jgi:hypothetical protein
MAVLGEYCVFHQIRAAKAPEERDLEIVTTISEM